MPCTHQTKTAKQEGPKDPVRTEVAAQMLGTTRARVYQYWRTGRLKAWRAKGSMVGLHGERPSFFFERTEVETLVVRLKELCRLQAELGHKPPGPRPRRATPTEWEECIPPGVSEAPEKGA